MANICEYKVMVKGKKNHCYALLGTLAKYDNNIILEEGGPFDDYTLVFQNSCKWSLSYTQTKEFDGTMPDEIPEDPKEAKEKFDGMYWEYTMEAQSKMFDVEIWYNSADIDSMFMGDCGHCKNGVNIDDDYPEILKIDLEDEMMDEDDIDDSIEVFKEIAEKIQSILPQDKLVEFMTDTEFGDSEWEKVSSEDLSERLFVVYMSDYMGDDPREAAEAMLEDYIDDELSSDVEDAIWVD